LPAEVTLEGAEEVELTDEELLGAATLAKISSQRRPVVDEDEFLAEEGAEEAVGEDSLDESVSDWEDEVSETAEEETVEEKTVEDENEEEEPEFSDNSNGSLHVEGDEGEE
jgi:hypothetical protein